MAFFLFLDKKKQKSSQQKMLHCRTGPLPCKSGKTSGCNLFALLSLAHALRFSKNLLCPSLHTGLQFYLLSPEADLLTNSVSIKILQ
jgi:hypothetical protein